ncbi:MAG: replicative DNA helicase [Defluviicoccus sp.]|nr:replicative DNA helicase [Defluviicoccus sp.]MDE0383207.1 replicative DNA helicase [Defluviicoccus sp.]
MAETVPVIESDREGQRSPPSNVEAEMGLLGAVLLNNRAFERVSEFLSEEHFSEEFHRRIWRACKTLIERGQRADPTTLRHFFESDEVYRAIGGAAYVARLAANATTVINAADYGRLIHDLFLRRELIELGTDIVNDAYAGDLEVSAVDQIESAEQNLYDLATTGSYEGGFRSLTEAVADAVDMAQAAFKRDGKTVGAPSGFTELDLMLGGLHKSDLIVLAGRPSMGKTALATNIAFHVAEAAGDAAEAGKAPPAVGFYSLEMSAEQLANRLVAEQTKISSDKIRRGEVNESQFERLVVASRKLEGLAFFIDDTPALTTSALRTRARRLKRQHGLALLVVDYLQLVSGSRNARNESRVQEVSEITRGLKTLAKELDVPVLALSQLSRAVESREDKRPQLADLRESGTIEQDADVVMFIYREEYYLERQEPSRRADEDAAKFLERQEQWEERRSKAEGRAEIIVAKQRHGPTGRIVLRFHPEMTKFENLNEARDAPY